MSQPKAKSKPGGLGPPGSHEPAGLDIIPPKIEPAITKGIPDKMLGPGMTPIPAKIGTAVPKGVSERMPVAPKTASESNRRWKSKSPDQGPRSDPYAQGSYRKPRHPSPHSHVQAPKPPPKNIIVPKPAPGTTEYDDGVPINLPDMPGMDHGRGSGTRHVAKTSIPPKSAMSKGGPPTPVIASKAGAVLASKYPQPEQLNRPGYQSEDPYSQPERNAPGHMFMNAPIQTIDPSITAMVRAAQVSNKTGVTSIDPNITAMVRAAQIQNAAKGSAADVRAVNDALDAELFSDMTEIQQQTSWSKPPTGPGFHEVEPIAEIPIIPDDLIIKAPEEIEQQAREIRRAQIPKPEDNRRLVWNEYEAEGKYEGLKYYYCKHLKISRWEQPKGKIIWHRTIPVGRVDKFKQVGATSWVRVRTTTRLIYFHNKISDDITWDCPNVIQDLVDKMEQEEEAELEEQRKKEMAAKGKGKGKGVTPPSSPKKTPTAPPAPAPPKADGEESSDCEWEVPGDSDSDSELKPREESEEESESGSSSASTLPELREARVLRKKIEDFKELLEERHIVRGPVSALPFEKALTKLHTDPRFLAIPNKERKSFYESSVKKIKDAMTKDTAAVKAERVRKFRELLKEEDGAYIFRKKYKEKDFYEILEKKLQDDPRWKAMGPKERQRLVKDSIVKYAIEIDKQRTEEKDEYTSKCNAYLAQIKTDFPSFPVARNHLPRPEVLTEKAQERIYLLLAQKRRTVIHDRKRKRQEKEYMKEDIEREAKIRKQDASARLLYEIFVKECKNPWKKVHIGPIMRIKIPVNGKMLIF